MNKWQKKRARKRPPKRAQRPARQLTGWAWVRKAASVLLLGTDFEVGALCGLLRNRTLGVVWMLAEAANAAQRGSQSPSGGALGGHP